MTAGKSPFKKKTETFCHFLSIASITGIFFLFLLLLLCNAVIHRRCFCSISRIANIKGVKAQRRGWEIWKPVEEADKGWKGAEMKYFGDWRRQECIGKKKKKCRNAKERIRQMWPAHFNCFIHSESSLECEVSEELTKKKGRSKKSDFSFSYRTHHFKPNAVTIIFFTEDCTLAKESWSPPSGQLKYRSMPNFNFLNF